MVRQRLHKIICKLYRLFTPTRVTRVERSPSCFQSSGEQRVCLNAQRGEQTERETASLYFRFATGSFLHFSRRHDDDRERNSILAGRARFRLGGCAIPVPDHKSLCPQLTPSGCWPRERPSMTSAKFSDLMTTYPLSAFGIVLYYEMHPTSLTAYAFP